MVFDKLKSKIASSKRQQQQNYSRINELTSEVCRYQNESMQVPVLKAKLDVLQQDLRSEKRKNNRLSAILISKNDFLEIPHADHLAFPAKNSYRKLSTFSIFDYPNVSIDDLMGVASFASDPATASVCVPPPSIIAQVPTLDPLLSTYQETNQQLLEKLKTQEMENTKLHKQIADLRYEVDILKHANDANVIKNRTASSSSTNNKNTTISTNSSYNHVRNFSVSDDYTDEVNSLFSSNYSANIDTPSTLFFNIEQQPTKSPSSTKFSRSDYYHRTLRNTRSQESLLSLNKSSNGDVRCVPSPKSNFTPNFKHQYYMPSPSPKKKRSLIFGHKTSKSVSSTYSNTRPLSAFFS